MICPLPSCGAPYTVTHRWVAESSDGPVECEKGSCAAGHHWSADVATMANYRAAKERLTLNSTEPCSGLRRSLEQEERL